MNPPPALYGAMNKERKPFTYTPGGLDLSEIKSERMAKRLMRNAMSQGVPEQPSPSLHSSPTPSTTLNAPNFNCLPVQVFPTFPLPANPKSLLRTRSNSNKQNERFEHQIPYEEQLTTNGTQLDSKLGSEHNNKDNSLKYIPLNFEKSDWSISSNQCYTAPKACTNSNANYGSSGYTEALSPKTETSKGNLLSSPDNHQKYIEDRDVEIEGNQSLHMSKPTLKFNTDSQILPTLTSNCISEKSSPKIFEEVTGTEDKQKEAKVVKKQINTEKVIEEQNGDTNVEAAVTVKLPGKKTSAKTETKVEVVKKELPDGSVEEVKTTTTKTTIDGKTEITTKTETTIIPKEDDLEEEEIVEEEEEEEQLENDGNEVVQKSEVVVKLHEEEQKLKQEPIQNITEQKETSESTTKNVTIIKSTESQNESEEEIEEEEEEEEEEHENVEMTVTQKEVEPNMQNNKDIDDKIESKAGGEGGEETSDKDEEVYQTTQEDNVIKSQTSEKEEEVEEVRELDKVNDVCESEEENGQIPLQDNISKDVSLQEKEEVLEEKDDIRQKLISESDAENKNEQINASHNETVIEANKPTQENKEETVIEVQVSKPELSTKEETKPEPLSDVKDKEDKSPTVPIERNIPLREPSVPLEKVEEVEIKPIGQLISKSHTENTEIITTSIDKPTTGLSTQTSYNRIENIVTVNRTTKTLDQAYEQISQQGVPTVKTYFAPNDRPLVSPQPSRTYQPVYTSEPQGERRHSLLLDRLSVDRQMPPTELYQSNYQYGNQTYEQNIRSQEPQSEVLTVSNVKPSSITKNQQWYQETKKDEVAYNSTAPSLNVPSQQWNLQQSHPQSQPQSQPQQHSQPQLESAYQPSLHYQSPYVQNTQDTYRATSNTSSNYQQNSYPSYTQKPASWAGNNINAMQATSSINKQSNQFSYIEKGTSESYQRPSQQFSSTYIPPPWEQDPNYVADNVNHTLYTPPTSNKFTNSANQTWIPPTANKFSKPKPTSYIPPAPNQSFVKPVTTADPPKMPGRKTYYSEYERRYISVPESTYIPTESKFEAQPNPSPQYYYDNNEPSENVEHEWRKELREFSEKTQTQSQSEKTLVKPPWEEDPKYYVPKVTTEYTPTPTWSQTLRPNSWRERSFESEFVRSQELPKTNTLGRGRPQSSYVKSNVSTPIPERPRGVSVDRYNPNNYKSPTPSEYPPVQSHTLDPSIGSKTYHNPNVPAHHSRASAEPREQVFPQTRQWGEARASPIQSRSFKYLQWITGTED